MKRKPFLFHVNDPYENPRYLGTPSPGLFLSITPEIMKPKEVNKITAREHAGFHTAMKTFDTIGLLCPFDVAKAGSTGDWVVDQGSRVTIGRKAFNLLLPGGRWQSNRRHLVSCPSHLDCEYAFHFLRWTNKASAPGPRKPLPFSSTNRKEAPRDPGHYSRSLPPHPFPLLGKFL